MKGVCFRMLLGIWALGPVLESQESDRSPSEILLRAEYGDQIPESVFLIQGRLLSPHLLEELHYGDESPEDFGPVAEQNRQLNRSLELKSDGEETYLFGRDILVHEWEKEDTFAVISLGINRGEAGYEDRYKNGWSSAAGGSGYIKYEIIPLAGSNWWYLLLYIGTGGVGWEGKSGLLRYDETRDRLEYFFLGGGGDRVFQGWSYTARIGESLFDLTVDGTMETFQGPIWDVVEELEREGVDLDIPSCMICFGGGLILRRYVLADENPKREGGEVRLHPLVDEDGKDNPGRSNLQIFYKALRPFLEREPLMDRLQREGQFLGKVNPWSKEDRLPGIVVFSEGYYRTEVKPEVFPDLLAAAREAFEKSGALPADRKPGDR